MPDEIDELLSKSSGDEIDALLGNAPSKQLSMMDTQKAGLQNFIDLIMKAQGKIPGVAESISKSPATGPVLGSLAAGAVSGGMGFIPAMGMQALGAAGGAGYGRLMQQPEASAGSNAKEMLKQAAIAAAGHGVGGLAGRGAEYAGLTDMGHAKAFAGLAEQPESIGIRKAVSTASSEPIVQELEALRETVRNAKNNGVSPISVLTDNEKKLYSQYKTPIDQSIENNVPIKTLVPDASVKTTKTAMVDVEPKVEKAVNDAVAKAPSRIDKNSLKLQLLQANQKMSEGDARFILENTREVLNAKPVSEAEKLYGEAAGGLKGKAKSLSDRYNVDVVGPPELDRRINEVRRIWNGTEIDKTTGLPVKMTPQDALDGIQSINKRMRSKGDQYILNKDSASLLNQARDRYWDYLAKNGNPELQKASRSLRASHLSEDLDSWFTLNKTGGPDRLRAFLSMLTAVKGVGKLASGNIPGGVMDIAAPVLASPKFTKNVLRAGTVVREQTPNVRAAISKALPAIPAATVMMVSRNGQRQEVPSELAARMKQTGQWQEAP